MFLFLIYHTGPLKDSVKALEEQYKAEKQGN